MLRLCRKTIYPRWHVNRRSSVEKKPRNCTKPKALVLCITSEDQEHSNKGHQKKQHADKQDWRCWDDPQFRFNFFKTSIFETAGWLGTVAVYLNFHSKTISNVIEYERVNSSCLFSNIVFAMPRRQHEDEKLHSPSVESVSLNHTVHSVEKDKFLPGNADILGSIKTLSKLYAVAVQNAIGTSYINKNDKKAFRYFQSAARHGSSAGFYNLGLCYQLGKGTRVNLNMAAFCYRKAALKGHGLASFNLATFFFRGIGGLPVDTKIAKELLAEAADKEVPEAQLYFGILFLEEKRWQEAVEIFSSLAEKNLPDAQYYLGLCFENGLGVNRSQKTADDLFRKSADQGNNKAIHKLQNNQTILNDEKHSFLKTSITKDIEESSSLHVSTSVPELSVVKKTSTQSIMKFPILSYLDLFTPLLVVKNDRSETKNTLFTNEKNSAQECSSNFLSLKSIPVVMQVKT